MKHNNLIFLSVLLLSLASGNTSVYGQTADQDRFHIEKDLLLAQFDCKTDVDDLHSAAALATLVAHPVFSKIHYHAVAGTYGIQEGLYVPPNSLFQLAFGDNWTDAHANLEAAVKKVKTMIRSTLAMGGAVWISEAGQSDFSAKVIKAVQQEEPTMNLSQRIHIVQHSDWNAKVTSPESLDFVKATIAYHKIPDGNAVGNGTPGFRTPSFTNWKEQIKNDDIRKIWELAITTGMQYNGVDGRYNNAAVAAGGVDFSDLSEVCWILDLESIYDTHEFFKRFAH